MVDPLRQEDQNEVDRTLNTRKRELTADAKDLENDEASERTETRQHKRARLDKSSGEKPQLIVNERRDKMSSANNSLEAPGIAVRNVEGMKTDRDKKDATKSKDIRIHTHEQGSAQRSSDIPVDNEQLCADGVSEMFLLKRAGSGPSVLLMKVAHQLARKVESQVMAGRTYRRAKDTLMPELERALRVNKATIEALVQRARIMVKLRGDRKPTLEEDDVTQRILQEARDLDIERNKIEAERTVLSRDIEFDRRSWETAVLAVEDTLQNVFVQCGLIDGARAANDASPIPQGDKSKQIQPSSGKGEPDSKAADVEPLNSNRFCIKLAETKARREVNTAQRQHDEHRNTFRRGLLAARIAAAADRPNAPKRLIEEEFSRDYVRAGSELAGAVTRAEAAREAALAAAKEAQVSIIGSDDDLDPNIPYDLQEFAKVKIKHLDSDAVELWNQAVEPSFGASLRPLGYLLHMSEKWKRALEGHDDVSSSEEELGLSAGAEECLEISATHDSVLKPASKRKAKHTQPYLSLSDCAQGKKRRRIEDWTRKKQQVCQQ